MPCQASAFQVVEQHLDRYSRSAKHRSSAKNIPIFDDDFHLMIVPPVGTNSAGEALYRSRRCDERIAPTSHLSLINWGCNSLSYAIPLVPDNIPVPQAWLEFEVENVEKATAGLESRGYRILIKNKKEPWGHCKPVQLTRGPAGRRHIHSVDARAEIIPALQLCA
jgi:hypothetical protein